MEDYVENLNKGISMLNSSDPEIQGVGVLTVAQYCGGWEGYNNFRRRDGYRRISTQLRKDLRKHVVAMYGKPNPSERKEYKTW